MWWLPATKALARIVHTGQMRVHNSMYISTHVFVYIYIYAQKGGAVVPGLRKPHFYHIVMSWEVYLDTTSLLETYIYIYTYI